MARKKEREREREREVPDEMCVPLDTFTDKGELKSCLAIRTAYLGPPPSPLVLSLAPSPIALQLLASGKRPLSPSLFLLSARARAAD